MIISQRIFGERHDLDLDIYHLLTIHTWKFSGHLGVELRMGQVESFKQELVWSVPEMVIFANGAIKLSTKVPQMHHIKRKWIYYLCEVWPEYWKIKIAPTCKPKPKQMQQTNKQTRTRQQ